MTDRKTSFPLAALLLLTGIFYLNFVSRVILAPLLPIVEKELSLSHGEAGSFFLFIACGYGIGLLGSGFVSSALNHQRAITLSTFMTGLAMLGIAQSTSLRGVYSGLAVVGVFTGFYLPSGIATLTHLTRREEWGKAVAIHELAPNFAYITAPLMAEFLIHFVPWRKELAIIGTSAILMSIVFFALGRGGKFRGVPPNFRLVRDLIIHRSFWMMTILFIVSIAASMGGYTMMPLFLVTELGMDRGFANTLIGLSRVFGIGAVFISGLIIDRLGPKHAMALFLASSGAFTTLLGLIPGSAATPLLVFLQSASAACCFPAGFTMLALVFPASLRGLAVSIIVFISFIAGGGLVPSGIGYFAQAFSFSSAFIVMGLFFLAVLPLFLRMGSRLDIGG